VEALSALVRSASFNDSHRLVTPPEGVVRFKIIQRFSCLAKNSRTIVTFSRRRGPGENHTFLLYESNRFDVSSGERMMKCFIRPQNRQEMASKTSGPCSTNYASMSPSALQSRATSFLSALRGRARNDPYFKESLIEPEFQRLIEE